MTNHSVTRTARGRIDAIKSRCGSDECPVEEVDEDDGSITYRCPETGDAIVTVDTDSYDVDAPNQPATTDELKAERRRRR